MYKNGQKGFKKSSTKRNTDRGVHRTVTRTSQQPRLAGEILSKMYEMFCMDHENKENPQIFVTYPVCFYVVSL